MQTPRFKTLIWTKHFRYNSVFITCCSFDAKVSFTTLSTYIVLDTQMSIISSNRFQVSFATFFVKQPCNCMYVPLNCCLKIFFVYGCLKICNQCGKVKFRVKHYRRWSIIALSTYPYMLFLIQYSANLVQLFICAPYH